MRFIAASALLFCGQAIAADEWEYAMSTDAFTDATVHRAFVVVVNNEDRGAGLFVTCTNDTLIVSVHMGLTPAGRAPVPVRWRIDQEEAVSDRWDASSDGSAIYPPNPGPLVDGLLRGAALLLEAHDYLGRPQRVRFPLNGSQAAISPVLTACE